MMNLGIEEIPHNWLEEIINLSAERIVIVDTEGIICYINEAYCEFLGTTIDKARKRPVQEVIENTRMHIVAKTGQAELGVVHRIKGNDMISNRYPLYVKGELVGAFGIVAFRNPEDLRIFGNKIQHLVEELNYYKTKVESNSKSKYHFHDLIGNSPEFLAVKTLAQRISGSQSAVLLLGESGTGKELFASAIHNNSLRATFPFIPINCASIPEHLLESELFGYEEGAFTGAKKGGKKGQFEAANKGTIFLDEIGDMPLTMQSKLLRVLQEKEVQRIGGQKSTAINVRIIAATHRDLEKMVNEGKFRQDLYYRLNVIKIEIPPLKKRKGDIELIANKLLERLEKKFHRKSITLSSDVITRLHQHSWPGNIRELENVLERSINVLDGQTIELAHLPLYLRDQEVKYIHFDDKYIENNSASKVSFPIQPLKETLMSVEKQAIINALVVTNGNKQEAAKLLEVGKTRFYEKCKAYDIK
jgi:transcriptional regulator with PAS, ATPase and Fis domain